MPESLCSLAQEEVVQVLTVKVSMPDAFRLRAEDIEIEIQILICLATSWYWILKEELTWPPVCKPTASARRSEVQGKGLGVDKHTSVMTTSMLLWTADMIPLVFPIMDPLMMIV